jgi:hypothetical protein
MPKPQKVDRPVEKHVNLPRSLTTKIDLLLFSELEGRVPFGAWSRLVEQLLKDYLTTRSQS